MAAATDTASTSEPEGRDKPIVVRVKRKPSQTRPDAFWLEINERPVKKAMLDFSSLSVSEPSSGPNKASEEPRVKKLLVQHIETVHHSEAVQDVLHFLLHSDLDAKEIKSKTKEWNNRTKQDKKQDQLRSAARQRHEVLGRNAHFAQIWRSRKGYRNEVDESLQEICHLYDAVQVDSDEEKHPAEPRITSFEEGAILCNFLPLIHGNICHQLLKKLNQILFRWHNRKIQMFMTYILSRRWMMIQQWRAHLQLHTHCYKWTMTMMYVMMMILMIQMIQMRKVIHSMIILKSCQRMRMMIPIVRMHFQT